MATFKPGYFCQMQRIRTVKKIGKLVPDMDEDGDVGERKYFYEVYGDGNKPKYVPVIYNLTWLRGKRLEAIENGDLRTAYIHHMACGYGELSLQEEREYPWWASFYERMRCGVCTRCQCALLEDRGISNMCWHQVCTQCANDISMLSWDNNSSAATCPTCGTLTRYIVLNGEQCSDNRPHFDVIIFEGY